MKTNSSKLLFVSLGGTEEIGMNLNLYGYGPPGAVKWVMIDLGITFGDDSTPGIDVMMPDPQFIEERLDDLEGLVLTHGHEDHLGAVPYLWPRLKCPVYATPFTAALLKRKLEMDGLGGQVPITIVPMQSRFEVGPFDLEFITLTHSMPEPNAIAIRTPAGTVLHTGDWKFDPDPVIGPGADEAALKAIGDEGVLAAIGDSTNSFVAGSSGSEAALLATLTEEIGKCTGKVAVACFASNVARLQTIFQAATANGRAVALAGRSLWRINAAARETGYLDDVPEFLDDDEANDIPGDEILYICTGSQGEPRAALSRIATDSHPAVTLGDGDTVIFSSRIIPGNELAIGRLQNRLAAKGVGIVTERDGFIHVSGHPAQDEMVRMYQHLRPRIAIPVHGERRHLIRHAELARQCQVPETIVVENGSVVRLAPGDAAIIDLVETGRIAVDGTRLVAMGGTVMRERRRALHGGTAALTLVLDGDGGMAADPQLSTTGLLDGDDEDHEAAAVLAAVRDAIADLSRPKARDDDAVRETARLAVRRAFNASRGKKPLTTVHVVRL